MKLYSAQLPVKLNHVTACQTIAKFLGVPVEQVIDSVNARVRNTPRSDNKASANKHANALETVARFSGLSYEEVVAGMEADRSINEDKKEQHSVAA